MAPIGVAIVGGGIFVKEEHLPAVEKCELLSLKAIFSRSLKTAQDAAALVTKNASPDLYSADAGDGKSYNDLLKRDDISAVIIALPITSQPEYIEAALAAGKHVLAEKPVAKDVADGKKLIDKYKRISAEQPVTLAIAENFRYTPKFLYARDEAAALGKVKHFNVRVFFTIGKDSKWYNTEWRKVPNYQGGFILDAGVHFTAATRLILSGESAAESVMAFTDLAMDHLPPLDTVNAVVRTKSGASGTYQHSAGSNIRAFDWDFGFENGRIQIAGDKVTVTSADGQNSTKEFEATSGVSEEVAAWAQALSAGKPDPLQSPEEALADLEFLEKIFQSGEQDGARQRYELQ